MIDETKRLLSRRANPSFRTTSEPILEDAATMAPGRPPYYTHPEPAMGPHLAVLQAPVDEVTVKRTDLQALNAAKVVREVKENVASRIVTSTEESLIEAMEVDISAIETGNQTTLTNLVDAALLKDVEDGLLHSTQEARLRNTTESDQLMDAIVPWDINNETFITPVAEFTKTIIDDPTEKALVQTLLQDSILDLDIGQKHKPFKVTSPPIAHRLFQHFCTRSLQSLVVAKSLIVGPRNRRSQRRLPTRRPMMGHCPIRPLAALALPSMSFAWFTNDYGPPWTTTPITWMADHRNTLLRTVPITRRTWWGRWRRVY